MTTIKGLTLWQPWASLVACGAKRIETRSWPAGYRGWLAIHAAKAFPDEALQSCGDLEIARALVAAGIRYPRDLPRGCIVAVANLHRVGRIGCDREGRPVVAGRDLPIGEQEEAFGDYTPGRFGWCLTNIRALAEPIPCKGAQGLWTVPSDIAAQLMEVAR